MANGSVCVLFIFLAFIKLKCVLSHGLDQRPSVCNLPIETGPCDGAIYRYSYKAETKNCVKYLYRGCGGNANQFDTMSECRKTCETDIGWDMDRRPSQCDLPIENFVCDGTVRKYAFDTLKSECVILTSDGCGENANRFDTMSECRKTCDISNSRRPHQCSLPIVPRDPNCNVTTTTLLGKSTVKEVTSSPGYSVSVVRYAFNVAVSQCVRFTHQGCHGNANRFETLQECRITCEIDS